MDTNIYKPNSHAYKEGQKNAPPEKKVEKVVSGKVKTKKNEVRKFTDIFIAEDVGNVKQYIFMDVLVPALKKAVSDIVRDGVDMLLYGESGRSKRSGGNGNYVSYRSYSDPRDNDRYNHRERSSSRLNYDDLIFENRGQADLVLDSMNDIIDTYGFVTVADLYDLCDLTAPYTGCDYGWTRLGSAEPVRTRDGYVLKLPRAIPIK